MYMYFDSIYLQFAIVILTITCSFAFSLTTSSAFFTIIPVSADSVLPILKLLLQFFLIAWRQFQMMNQK